MEKKLTKLGLIVESAKMVLLAYVLLRYNEK